MSKRFAVVLISSVSKKVPLIKGVRRALAHFTEKAIIGGDADSGCIGRFFVDQFWEMPRLDRLSPEILIASCQVHGINRIIPTRDGELLFYAENKERFAREGIHVMISDSDGIKICLDKLLFYQTLSGMGYPAIQTAESAEELECEKFVVKERFGAGSRNLGLNLSRQEALSRAKHVEHPVFQPFIEGKEISVDLYLAQSGKAKGVILRRRDLIVQGESQVTTSFANEEIENLCVKIGEDLGLYGHVMFQMILSPDGTRHILEGNPRFGGASTLSLEMGLDSFLWFFLEASGEDLSQYPFRRSESEKCLVRYPEDMVLSCDTNV